MANAKRYKILVGSEVVYVGPWRTADIIFNVIRRAFPNVVVTLAFDI